MMAKLAEIYNDLVAVLARLTGATKPWLIISGMVCAAALALQVFGISRVPVLEWRLPLVSATRDTLAIAAAVLIWAGR